MDGNDRVVLAVMALTLVGGILAGCQTLGQADIGKQVPPGTSMVIQSGGPHAQTFQTNDWDFKIPPGSKAIVIGYDGNTEPT